MYFRRAVTVLFLLLTAAASGRANPDHILVAKPIESIKLDGKLEKAWFSSDPADSFTQIRPHEGALSSFGTRVYIRYTPEALLIGIDCRDAHPDKISGRVQRRDQFENSDYMIVGLDPFHDKRTGYFFGVTAGGVQLDGVVSNESNYDLTWNGIWDSAVQRTKTGWTAELEIPFSSFRHGNGSTGPWGLNFERFIYRLDEESHWRPQSRTLGNRVSQWGELRGLHDIQSGAHLEVLPHVVGRWDAAEGTARFGDQNGWDNLGLDMKLVPSPTWTMDVTLQPDFAQVDVDDEVINLSDYPVYLPEKRPFFLEGLDLFQGTPFDMLYTRKITNPDAGTRVTGQWGALRGSALAAKNISEDGIQQNVAAARGVVQVGEISTVGFIGTALNQNNVAEYDEDLDTTFIYDHQNFHSYSGGVDARLRWGEENRFEAMLAGVDRTDSPDQPLGLSMEIQLSNEKHLRYETGLEYTGKDFNINDLGFSGYTNKVGQWFWIQYVQNPKLGLVEAWHLNLNFYHEEMPDGSLYERNGNWNADISTRSGWYYYGGMTWGSGWFRERTQLDSSIVWDSKYTDNFGAFYPEFHPYDQQWIGFESDERNPVDLSMHLEKGAFREGRHYSVYSELNWRLTPSFEFSGGHDWTRVTGARRVNDGATSDFTISRFRIRWSPTLDFSIRATTQFIHEDKRIMSNLLFAWNWAPGSWAYLVYDEGRPTDQRLGYKRADRTIRLKWTWFTTIG